MILDAVLSFCEYQLLSAIFFLTGTSITLESGKEKGDEFILADIAVHQWNHYKWRMRFAPSGLNQAYGV